MKNLRSLFYVMAILFTSFKQDLLGQSPASANFNIIFENNFNDDILGKYLVSDYLQDFSPLPVTIPSNNRMDIVKDSDLKYDKFMRGYFPKGTYLPDQHGYLFMSYLDNPVNELYFSFDVRFKDGFQWVKGGKLPGLTGGKIVSGVYPKVTDGFSARMVWKEDGKLYFYVYHQNQYGIYGDMYEFVNFKFTSGKWYNISMRLVVNTFSGGVAQSNGILEGFVDGKLYVQKSGIKFRGQEQIKIDDMYICSFFGGNTPDWAATRDEWVDVDNFVSYVYSNSALNVPKGNQLSSASKVLLHPYYTFGVPTPESPSTPEASPTGLQAHYVYENSAQDISGSGPDGILQSGASFSSAKYAQGLYCLSLDGINDYMDLGSMNMGNQFTVSSWVYIPSGSSNIRTLIANTNSGSNSNGFKIFVNTYGTTDRKIIVETGNGSASSNALSKASAVTFDKWNHVAVTINKTTGAAKIYCNGTDVTSSSAVLNNFGTNQITRIGSMNNGNFPMRGFIDDTRIYNRILTASEISGLAIPSQLKNSTSNYSTAVLLPEEGNTVIPVIYPNPFTDRVSVRSDETIVGLEVYNVQGVKVNELKNIESGEVSLSELLTNDMIFLVKIYLKNKEIHTLKILRQK